MPVRLDQPSALDVKVAALAVAGGLLIAAGYLLTRPDAPDTEETRP